MSRIDQQVASVQNKLALGQFVRMWAWTLLIASTVILLAVVVRQFTLYQLPKETFWLYGALSIATMVAMIFAIVRRPNNMVAAVAIDERLGLKEKFSTAIHARTMRDDPFAEAAILDAERTAGTVDLHQTFPLTWPKQLGYSVVIGLVTAGLLLWVEPRNLFASTDQPKLKKLSTDKDVEDSKKIVQQALDAIAMAPPDVQGKEEIKMARSELALELQHSIPDPVVANRKALSALQEVNKDIKQQIAQSNKFAEAKANENMLKGLSVDPNEKGPVAEASRDLAKGDLKNAMDKLDQTVKNFDKMSEEQKEKAADQMQKLSQQLQQMANDPKVKQQAEDKLKQMGMNQQQIQQAQQLMQQAAQGDKQAQQQLQQVAKQAMQNMNGGQGPTQQQQQQAQGMLNQLQAAANSQQAASNMQAAAGGLAQAMKQATSGQQAQSGQQAAGQQSGQQPNPQQGNQPGQQAGQQPGQQANSQQPGQQPGGQQGNQPGQQPGNQPGGQQSMQQAMGDMQKQVDDMKAMSEDAQEVEASQQASEKGEQDAQQAVNGQQGGQGQGQNKGQGQGQGQQANGGQGQNQGQGKGNGAAGQGQGAGQRGMEEAPFTVKKEVSPSKDNAGGKIIAATLVKADSKKGEAKLSADDIKKAVEQQDADEIETDRVGRAEEKAVKDYFNSLAEENKKK